MKKRRLLPAGLLVLLVTPVLVLAVIPGSWLIAPLESAASTMLGRRVNIDGLELERLSTTPSAKLVGLEDDSDNPLVRVWQANVAMDAPASLPAIAALALNDVTIDYQNTQSGLSASFLVDASGSTLADDIDTNVRAVGEFNGQSVELLDLKALPSSFNGAIQYQALTVQSPVWPVDAIDLRIEVQSDRLALSPVKVGLAGGRVEGSLEFELDKAVPAATVEAQVNQVGLRQIMAATGIDDDSFGNLGGRLKFWMQGQSVAKLAASAVALRTTGNGARRSFPDQYR